MLFDATGEPCQCAVGGELEMATFQPISRSERELSVMP
jgi:hypothetical protein